MDEEGFSSLQPVITPQALKEMCEGDPILMKCYESMIKYCTKYAHDVFNMIREQKKVEELRKKGEVDRTVMEELVAIDHARRRLHEATTDSINLLSRELGKRELDNEWVRPLVEGGRAAYGTFALLTFYKIYSTMESAPNASPSNSTLK